MSSASKPSQSINQSTSHSVAPLPVFLEWNESSFVHIRLKAHNFLHVFVGRVQRKLMVLPVILHCHSSILQPNVSESTNQSTSSAVNQSLDQRVAQLVLSRLFGRLPSLIADVNLSRVSTIKSKPSEFHSDCLTFTVQFRNPPVIK